LTAKTLTHTHLYEDILGGVNVDALHNSQHTSMYVVSQSKSKSRKRKAAAASWTAAQPNIAMPGCSREVLARGAAAAAAAHLDLSSFIEGAVQDGQKCLHSREAQGERTQHTHQHTTRARGSTALCWQSASDSCCMLPPCAALTAAQALTQLTRSAHMLQLLLFTQSATVV
jgi:hypothetical protein